MELELWREGGRGKKKICSEHTYMYMYMHTYTHTHTPVVG